MAVISILAAVLFPVFARARENARRASCQSNLKQVALASMQYAQDYDEHVTPTEIESDIIPTSAIFDQRLQPYAKCVQVFACPSNANTQATGALLPSPAPQGHINPFHTSDISSARASCYNGTHTA